MKDALYTNLNVLIFLSQPHVSRPQVNLSLICVINSVGLYSDMSYVRIPLKAGMGVSV